VIDRPRLDRRAFLTVTLSTAAATALGRTPYGGALRLAVPWAVDSLDPHAADDPMAALFGSVVADPLYATDERGRAYPTLASVLPETTPRGAKVTLRPNLNTAAGRALDSRDVVFSLDRARRAGALAVLARFEPPRRDPLDALAIVVPNADPGELAVALASPLTAILPRGFSPLRPDATGAFRAVPSPKSLLLERNPKAARGPAFLERVVVEAAPSLADALRAFEAGDADVGWLGSGLHRRRGGALPLEGGRFGWVVLLTGRDAGAWGAPGVAERLIDGIAPEQLAHLGLRRPRSKRGAPLRWGGGTADFVVRQDAPHLVQIARALTALLDQPGHTLRLFARPRAEVRALKQSGRFTLLLDFVRAAEPASLVLLQAADRSLVARPPPGLGSDLRQLGRLAPLGVLGELHVVGARAPAFVGVESWNLGSVWKAPS
jgi:peptide/nickel transport system substrate-binding protein